MNFVCFVFFATGGMLQTTGRGIFVAKRKTHYRAAATFEEIPAERLALKRWDRCNTARTTGTSHDNVLGADRLLAHTPGLYFVPQNMIEARGSKS